MNPLTQSKNTTILPLLVALTLGCVALSPQARAVCQEGCLTNNNTVLGEDALLNNTSGNENTAIGFEALFSNTEGFANTAIGSEALFNNTGGLESTAIGFNALFSNIRGEFNTATGTFALYSNTFGDRNTANGSSALSGNSTGSDNTATGFDALLNTTGHQNTATGSFAMGGFFGSTGSSNTATGYQALLENTTGNDNTATGAHALYFNHTGDNNTAIGFRALFENTTGENNIGLGRFAGQNLTTGDNNIDIGNRGLSGESNTIRIGTTRTHEATFIAGISGATVPTGVAVIVDADGHLGTTTSSARFKEAIRAMDKSSEVILALKPVSFHYKKEIDPDGIPQFGLVAEEVEKVNPDLVARDPDGKAYTVRYEVVNAMLLNEFLKEHQRNEAQQKQIEALTAIVKEQAAQIQQVNARLATIQPVPRLVSNE
jgi:trimeric autotransporter adhesin